jgi:hypothetical protein
VPWQHRDDAGRGCGKYDHNPMLRKWPVFANSATLARNSGDRWSSGMTVADARVWLAMMCRRFHLIDASRSAARDGLACPAGAS